jgi:hypothetical protein
MIKQAKQLGPLIERGCRRRLQHRNQFVDGAAGCIEPGPALQHSASSLPVQSAGGLDALALPAMPLAPNDPGGLQPAVGCERDVSRP